MTLSLLSSANLVRPGFHPNEPSHMASRHRLRRPQRQGHASAASRSDATIYIHIVGKTASLERSLFRAQSRTVQAALNDYKEGNRG